MAKTNLIATQPFGDAIPRLIHQTFGGALPEAFARNIAAIKAMNPEWQHCFYDDEDIVAFIREHYGEDMLRAYQRINPRYGAARADLFRYLLLYRRGGVYLDIKSTTTQSLDETLRPDDRFVVSQWRNGPGEAREGWGIHPELADIPGGEFQQWHIVCAPGHPFLKAVIESVLARIDAYRPWRERLGQQAVVRVTGPIAYTLAIRPLLSRHPHRRVRDEAVIGLSYSIMPDHAHAPMFKSHYVRLLEPLIDMKGLTRLPTAAYLRARLVRDRLVSWRAAFGNLLSKAGAAH